MVCFVHLATEGEDDALVQAARHLVSLLKAKTEAEGPAFEQKFENLYTAESGDGDFVGILKLFCHYAPTIFTEAEEKPKEVEGIFALLISLIQLLEDEESLHAMTAELCEQITANTSHPMLRLKLLMMLYNFFKPKAYAQGGTTPRYAIFKHILLFSCATSLFDPQILPYVNQLDEWIIDWNINVEQQRELYGIVQRELPKQKDRQEMAYLFLQKYLVLFNQASIPELNEEQCYTAALSLVKMALALPKVFEVDSIMALRAVMNLQGKHQALIGLMKIFMEGRDPKSLDDFQKRYPTVFQDYDIDYEAFLGKLRILTLASLAQEKQELSLEVAAKTLHSTVDDAEIWVVKGISAGVIQGRIDQLTKTVKVKSCIHRTLGPQEWKALKGRLEKWIDNIQALTKLMKMGAGPMGHNIAAEAVRVV